MKKLLLIAFILFAGNATASSLPNCSTDFISKWDNCFGTYTYANGDTYVGEFKDSKQHGQATFTSANGDKYVGEFKDGILNGQGTMTFADGTVKKGVWEKGSYFGTKAEWDAKIAKEEYEKKLLAEKIAKEEKERLAREREAEKKYNTIYNACLLDKSKEVDMQVSTISEAVYQTCKDIATDPSWYENFKYNK